MYTKTIQPFVESIQLGGSALIVGQFHKQSRRFRSGHTPEEYLRLFSKHLGISCNHYESMCDRRRILLDQFDFASYTRVK